LYYKVLYDKVHNLLQEVKIIAEIRAGPARSRDRASGEGRVINEVNLLDGNEMVRIQIITAGQKNIVRTAKIAKWI
jgi:hypothetical protein